MKTPPEREAAEAFSARGKGTPAPAATGGHGRKLVSFINTILKLNESASLLTVAIQGGAALAALRSPRPAPNAATP